MNRVIFLIALALMYIQTGAQTGCKDIVYPSDGNEIIFDCCITAVKYGNIVHYKKDGKLSITPAVAITRDGQYLDLSKYKDQIEGKANKNVEAGDTYYKHDYNYYKEIYNKASTQRGVGIVLTFLGLGCEIWGYTLLIKEDMTIADEDLGTGLVIGGAVLETIGIPLWISGGIKRGNNKRVMEDMEKNMNLSFGASRNGVGIVLRF